MMNESVKISVIIPIYNIKEYIERCVYSVIRQTYHNLEIILVDDGSTDGSDLVCDRLAKKDERIIVIHKKNGGLADARNAGIDRAGGEIFSFVDGDDYIEHNMYEVMVRAMKSDVSLVTCGMRVLNSEGVCFSNVVWNKDRTKILTKKQCLQAFLTVGYNGFDVSCCNKLFRRELFADIRFINGIISEDIECLYRILDKVDKCACVNKSLYIYTFREGSITHSVFSKKNIDFLHIIQKIVADVEMRHPELVKDVYRFELQYLLDCWKLVQSVADKERKQKWKERIRKRIRVDLAVNRKRKEIGNYQFVTSRAILLGCDEVTEKMFKLWFAVKAPIKCRQKKSNNT